MLQEAWISSWNVQRKETYCYGLNKHDAYTVGQSNEEVYYEQLSKDQLHSMISYLSSQLQSPNVTSTTEKATASTSTNAPVISQIT